MQKYSVNQQHIETILSWVKCGEIAILQKNNDPYAKFTKKNARVSWYIFKREQTDI